MGQSLDELFPDDYDADVATGDLIRNYYSLNPNDWMRSAVEHTGKSLLGLTFNCAHCHDHKYDPIEQNDYFRLRAFFEPVFIDVVVVFGTEFGRTPGLELRGGGTTGRDHHPNGFTIWMAGAGLKRGHVHGATDELGYHALGEGHYVTDLHATVLHLLGLDNRRLEVPGRKRLDIDHGRVIGEALA